MSALALRRWLVAGTISCTLCGVQAAGTVTFCSDGAPEGFDVVQYETVITNDASGLSLIHI